MFSTDITILIVDDMPTMRKMVEITCKQAGFKNFVTAGDGIDAFEKVQNANPPIGLIISDWAMPKCTGLDFLIRVRAESRYKHLPFLMVTAEAEQEQIKKAIQSGVSSYVVKPFTSDTLKEKLKLIYDDLAKTG